MINDLDKETKRKLTKMIDSAKSRAKTKGLVFSITREDIWNCNIRQKGLCAYSGIPLNWDTNHYNTNPEYASKRPHDRVSLDRVDNTKGYTLDNVQLICDSVNKAKSDLPEEYFLFLCNSISLHRGLM